MTSLRTPSTLLTAALTVAALAVMTASAAPALAAPGDDTPIELDKESIDAVRAYLDGVAGELTAVLTNAPGKKNKDGTLVTARDLLLERSIVHQSFDKELADFVRKAGEIGTMKSVAFTGFEVRATMWFGLLPVQEVDLNFWNHKSRARLLRISNRPTQLRAFGNPSQPAWAGKPAESFGVLADQILRTIVEGGCKSVPTIRAADHKVALPRDKTARKATLAAFERFQRDLDRACKDLTAMPYQRVTWHLGDANGVLTTKTGDKISFKLGLTPGPNREVRLYHLTRPVDRRKKKD